MSDRLSPLTVSIAFLRSIGLSVEQELSVEGFLDGGGVLIRDGSLRYDPARATVSYLLHEAGHLAIMPMPWRALCQRDVDGAVETMFLDLAKMNLHPDHPLSRAAIQCSDSEATAWAWAAGAAIGLKPKQIIEDWQYEGTGKVERERLMPSLRAVDRVSGHLGIHGLAHAGFCALAANRPLPMYPKLRMWLQDATPIPQPTSRL